MALNLDDMKLAVEAVSGGENTVLFDDHGYPSIMVPINKLMNSDIVTGGSSIVHPGFQVNSVEKDVMYFSKFQNIVMNDRAYSLPLRDPKASINFDTSLAYCRNKGKGWSLTPFSLWAAVALWTKKNGTMPHGNNNFGQDSAYSYEKGTPATRGSDTRPNRCLTGSGPKTWYHDHTKNGIADLNGNVWEWNAGLRLNDGEINIIPYANAMDSEVSLAAGSTAWKAIAADGSLVEPGTSGSLKYDYLNSKITLINGTVTDDGSTGRGTGFKDLALASGLTAPELIKALILYPEEAGDVYGGDNRYATLGGERMAVCGGAWTSAGGAGVFCVYLHNPRSYAYGDIGFRAAYCPL
jgi:hypothetical protein